MPHPPLHLNQFSALVEIVEALRGPDGCPWDKEQTHTTLTQYAIEEAHELAEAIEMGEKSAIVEELGDLLLQVVLHAEIARQANSFTLADIIQTINQKMIRRHPHVFAKVEVADSQEVLRNWSKIKEQEKARDPRPETGFSIPVNLPALQRSAKIGEKTHKFNFDWQQPQEVLKKVHEELTELEDAMQSQELAEIHAELGDLLFSVAQLARHLRLDGEQCLRDANRRFEQRFFTMLKIAGLSAEEFSGLAPSAKESLWAQAKRQLKSNPD